MATGDQNDIGSRLFRWLPTGWFPVSPGTRIRAILAGFASVLSTLHAMVVYAKAQTRIATATDGFLDIISRDFLGSRLPRLKGETDPAFSLRIRENIFLAADTRPAIQKALENLTGNPVRMIEPWQPRDGFVWGRSFWGVDTRANPGQWSNGDARFKGLIICTLPAGAAANLPRSWWRKFFWKQSQVNAAAAGAWWLQTSSNGGAQLVFDAIKRLKVYGTIVFVKFVSPGTLS